MDNISSAASGAIAGTVGRTDLWMFLLVTAGLGWLIWPRTVADRRRQRRPDGAGMRRLSRAEHNLRSGEPMAGYGA